VSSPGTTEPTGPGWRELRALWPLLVLLALVVTWTNLQFGSLWSLVKTSGAFVLIGAVLRFLPSSFATGVRADFANALRPQRRAWALWIAIAIFTVASLFLGSAKVKTDKLTHPVEIYWTDSSGQAPAGGHKMLDSNSERSFHIPLPFAKRVYLASSNNEMSRVLTVYPWKVRSVTYPRDFSTLPELAVLLAPKLRLLLGGGRWLRLVIIREGPSPKILAEDTLRAFRSRMVVFDTSALLDETVRARWLPIATDSLSLDAPNAQLVVEDWLQRRLLRSSEPLLPDQQIRVVLLNQNNDTIKIARVTLTPGLSNVVLRK